MLGLQVYSKVLRKELGKGICVSWNASKKRVRKAKSRGSFDVLTFLWAYLSRPEKATKMSVNRSLSVRSTDTGVQKYTKTFL